uniref:Uncharacterized protein n=1 Tax=Cacopsylla melanoneura TaxID=428564 RepID=A0A8D8TC77_9HEMI
MSLGFDKWFSSRSVQIEDTTVHSRDFLVNVFHLCSKLIFVLRWVYQSSRVWTFCSEFVQVRNAPSRKFCIVCVRVSSCFSIVSVVMVYHSQWWYSEVCLGVCCHPRHIGWFNHHKRSGLYCTRVRGIGWDYQ